MRKKEISKDRLKSRKIVHLTSLHSHLVIRWMTINMILIPAAPTLNTTAFSELADILFWFLISFSLKPTLEDFVSSVISET